MTVKGLTYFFEVTKKNGDPIYFDLDNHFSGNPDATFIVTDVDGKKLDWVEVDHQNEVIFTPTRKEAKSGKEPYSLVIATQVGTCKFNENFNIIIIITIVILKDSFFAPRLMIFS